MNIAIYSRKSCTSDKGESVQNQIEICKNYIFSHVNNQKNSSIIIYKDEGFSAKNTDRPAFKQMLKDAENKKISHIVCYRLDRISRNVSDFSKLIEKFNKANISLICVKEQFDTSVPMGRAMMYMASVFAQLERETIAERVRDNMLILAKNGQWLGGTTPLGMRSHKVYDKNSGVNSKYKFYLLTDKKEIEIVKKIYSKFLECKSLTETKKYLESLNIKSRNKKSFSIPAIKKILTNPVYCSADNAAINYFKNMGADVCFSSRKCNKSAGIIAYNKRNYCKNNGNINSIKDWIIALGKHSGTISGKKWIEIHNFFNLGFKKVKFKDKSFLLSGKIFCKICGSKMLVKSNNYNKNFNYICSKKIYNSAKKCTCNNLNGSYVDKLIISKIILEGIKNNQFFIKKLNVIKDNLSISNTLSLRENTKIHCFTASKILENIDKKAQVHFASKTTECVFWNNAYLSIKLKNRNY
ncbi:MAG: recombinase family protein [Clostridia bacterium]|nr:recombinase family protein [Clostridia bacterium]